MKRQMMRFSWFVIGMSLCAACTMLLMGVFSTKQISAQSNCTLSTLKGTYLFQAQGVVVEDGEVLPYAEAGTWNLDGKGNAAGMISGSINGVPFATADAFTATYTLESGCVYKVVDAFGLELELYTSPAGKTMTYSSAGFSGTQFKQ